MYELTGLFIGIAGCAATIIAIVGGFIASKLISLNIERKEIRTRIAEIEEEILYKSKKVADSKEELDEDDALDFIHGNIEGVIVGKALGEIYKVEERLELSQEEMEPYWTRAIKICEQLLNDTFEEVNEDGIPKLLAINIKNNFEYKVCQYAIEFEKSERRKKEGGWLPSYSFLDSYALNTVNLNNNWYQQTCNEMNKTNASVEWLEIQLKQLLTRQKAITKPKGVKGGLVIFGIFSVLDILAPLSAVPYSTECYCNYLIVKSSVIGIFAILQLSVFIYLVSLLKCEE